MSLEHPACRLEDQGLSRMQSGQIRSAAGGLVETDGEHCIGVIEKRVGLVEEGARLRFHKSMPSARISCISGTR
jgi:hypothetical protein